MDGGASIIVVKLLRTDTTLDLSQKARVVKIQQCPAEPYIVPAESARASLSRDVVVALQSPRGRCAADHHRVPCS